VEMRVTVMSQEERERFLAMEERAWKGGA